MMQFSDDAIPGDMPEVELETTCPKTGEAPVNVSLAPVMADAQNKNANPLNLNELALL